MGRAGALRLLRSGTIWYTLTCVASAMTLVASGVAYAVVRDVSGIGFSHAITSGPSTGAQNILLMGLESRTDWNGNILPAGILEALHAGTRQEVEDGGGGNATNTLILLHIPANGRKAVGFSIPRDDWVQFASTVGPEQSGKIDQAYGVSMYYEQQKLRAQDPHMSKDELAFLGNEAGRRAAVATVEKLTGVHIDHFAEVNMDGFYELAKVLGGVEVCLRQPVDDPYSGADFPAGYQHLDARQALAFVRQRHGLPNGDLDRTHRQQAFLDSVMQQLRTEGALSDLTKLEALMSVARRYVITDAGWNLLDFAAQVAGLNSRNVIFHTLPIEGFATIEGQDANVVNPAYVKAVVQAGFSPKPSPPRPRRPAAVDVFNGGETAGLAATVSAAFTKAGYKQGQVGNTAARTTTAVRYGRDASSNARTIAALFGVKAAPSAHVAAGHVEILLGASATVPHIKALPKPRAPSVAIPTTGAQGGAVRAKNGIPCVN